MPERARLKRLQRLERVRAIARQTAAVQSAEAEGTLAQLRALADRTQDLAQAYRDRAAPGSGHDMRQVAGFVAGLSAVETATRGDAERARVLADHRQIELAAAERRRAAAEDRARDQAQRIANARQPQALGGRRPVGTGLE